MRRPAPLPPTRNTPGTTEPSAARQTRVDEPDAPSADAITAELDVLPGPHAALEPEATSPEAGSSGEVVLAADPEQTPIGVRDVWRAARARRRALRAEVRRFTARQRRRRMLWIGVAGALVLLVLGSLGAAYSPLFAVEKIRVVGAEQLGAEVVETALGGQLGVPLPLVDESAIKGALVKFPLVESYTLQARPPHELVVRIVERTPMGLIESAAGYTLIDSAGVVLSTTPEPIPGMPLMTIAGGTDSSAFEAVGQVMRALPESIRVQVTAVSATTPDDVTLALGGSNAQIVWGSAEDSARKAVVLETAMMSRPPASVLVYDVSSPHAIVVR